VAESDQAPALDELPAVAAWRISAVSARHIRHYAWVPEALGDTLSTFAEMFREKAGGWKEHLDYSIASANAVDNIVDLLLKDGDSISDDAQMAIAAYVGEIIRRNIGGEWIAMPDGPTPNDPGLSLNGVGVLPFEKVRKRVALGPTNSVGFFVEELAQSANLPRPQRAARWSRFRRKDH
jgi:hypothetical protein